jgi:hypothetical protein
MTGRPGQYTRPHLGQNGIVGLSNRSYDSIVGAKGHGTRPNSEASRNGGPSVELIDADRLRGLPGDP